MRGFQLTSHLRTWCGQLEMNFLVPNLKFLHTHEAVNMSNACISNSNNKVLMFLQISNGLICLGSLPFTYLVSNLAYNITHLVTISKI